jgi:hypothetical protein
LRLDIAHSVLYLPGIDNAISEPSMPILLQPLPDTRDTPALLDARAALLTARAAISNARSACHSYEAHQRLGELIITLEAEIEGIHGIVEAVFDDDDEREARAADAARGNFRYARA